MSSSRVYTFKTSSGDVTARSHLIAYLRSPENFKDLLDRYARYKVANENRSEALKLDDPGHPDLYHPDLIFHLEISHISLVELF